jgi:hypothetical protein
MDKGLKLGRLEGREELKDVLYHIRGILEVQSTIVELLIGLDECWGRDKEKKGEILGRIEAEVFFHLKYHIRELKRPFEILIGPGYTLQAELDDEKAQVREGAARSVK